MQPASGEGSGQSRGGGSLSAAFVSCGRSSTSQCRRVRRRRRAPGAAQPTSPGGGLRGAVTCPGGHLVPGLRLAEQQQLLSLLLS